MAEAAKKPGALTAAAVLTIIFTAWSIIASVIGIGTGAATLAFGIVGILTLVASIVGLAIGILGLVGAIMLLANKKAGVGFTRIWCFERFINFVLFIVTVLIGASALTSTAAAATSMADVNISASALGAGIGIVTGILAVFPMAVPALIVLILVGSKKVKEYFAAQA
jgi:hypothetical protein